MVERQKIRTQVGIVGAGPAGLMLSHLLARSGIDSVVIEKRTRTQIEETIRAGILEAGSVRLLVDSGVSRRVLDEGDEHEGVELRFSGEGHRIDFQDLVGESVWLYPQTEVFIDLADARERDDGDVRFSVTDTSVTDVLGSPRIQFTDTEGMAHEIECDFVVGADGSRSICRQLIPAGERTDNFREYPFAWFGILTEAPPSAPELIYAHSDRGFALISQRTETVQRMYFQCDPTEDASAWSEARIWEELQARVAGNGFSLKEGPIFDQMVLPFRSYVCEPMRYGNLFLAGDAAHTVPPTGAKGLNLALNDMRVLHLALAEFYATGSQRELDAYSERALNRVWKSQNFSYWMTTLLHTMPAASDFDNRRQLAELNSIVTSRAGSTYLAEAYTGWPQN
ncbi:4-hydroxybenzoate 3-monooxygenase [Klugiella xanthotipulae]|uniref:p-hydroxybenzoate 3-monooxygenase n=1 Tax=Klugiella xanthotipulae TaxID=244735 RepID=A0A543HT84_9MICO|nr:4-hydroxybenzoate 3-monooxygenase [Klugiella xanthotipulae]TQM61563.1 p-hydroxybenzoate 3-monooxygenase [Klugiella xanthotipulae]